MNVAVFLAGGEREEPERLLLRVAEPERLGHYRRRTAREEPVRLPRRVEPVRRVRRASTVYVKRSSYTDTHKIK